MKVSSLEIGFQCHNACSSEYKGPPEAHEIILRFYKQIDLSFLSVPKGSLEDHKRGMVATVRGELKPERLKSILH